jgi:hypothetical protein
MAIEVSTDLDFLIPELRMKLWDIDATSYRYLDSWLKEALVTSLKTLQRWWRIRYEIDETDYSVSRYVDSTFSVDSPPVIMHSDEMPIILMACVLIKSGVMENNSWTTGSWKDAEIAVSNIESGRVRDKSLQRDWDALQMYLKPPTKRLGSGARTSIPGAEEYNE